MDYSQDPFGIDMAIRDIAAGEEITTNYADIEEDGLSWIGRPLKADASEQADDLAVLDVDGVRGGDFWQARHGHDLTADRHHELGARREPHLAHRDAEAGGRALRIRVGRE